MGVTSTHFSLDFSAAPGDELIIFGDMHGRANLFEMLLETAAHIDRPAETRRKFITLGDLIDRGPSSLRCIDLAMGAREMTGADEVVGLMGNHEQMLLIGLINDGTIKGDHGMIDWLNNGGRAVLKEMGIENTDDAGEIVAGLGRARISWLMSLVSHYVSGEILAVHAGVNPYIPLEKFLSAEWDVDLRALEDSEHWAWIRETFLRYVPKDRGHQGYFVVHGHSTPMVDLASTRTQVERSRLNLDGGTYLTGKARMVRIVGNEATLFEAAAD